MRHFTLKRILCQVLFCFICTATDNAQGIRFTSQILRQATVATVTNVATMPANPFVAFCNAPASGAPCTNLATTYTDATLTTACPTATQLVLDGTNSCTAAVDAQDNWGVWVAPNSAGYAYTVTVSGTTFGPYYVLSQTTAANLNPANFNGI